MGSEIVPLKFSHHAITWFIKAVALDYELHYTGKHPNPFGIAKLLYLGYKNQCLLSEKEPVLDLVKFMEWVEQTEEDKGLQEEMNEALNAFAASPYMKKLVAQEQQQAADAAKKKAIEITTVD